VGLAGAGLEHAARALTATIPPSALKNRRRERAEGFIGETSFLI